MQGVRQAKIRTLAELGKQVSPAGALQGVASQVRPPRDELRTWGEERHSLLGKEGHCCHRNSLTSLCGANRLLGREIISLTL